MKAEQIEDMGMLEGTPITVQWCTHDDEVHYTSGKYHSLNGDTFLMLTGKDDENAVVIWNSEIERIWINGGVGIWPGGGEGEP